MFSLAESAALSLRELVGLRPPVVRGGTASPAVQESIRSTIAALLPHWQCLKHWLTWPVTEEAAEIDPEISKSRISKIYNCFDCNRMFMSAEAHANHLRDVHGGEGGSVLLKLPRDKVNGNDIEQDSDEEVDKPDNDELVIDEM